MQRLTAYQIKILLRSEKQIVYIFNMEGREQTRYILCIPSNATDERKMNASACRARRRDGYASSKQLLESGGLCLGYPPHHLPRM